MVSVNRVNREVERSRRSAVFVLDANNRAARTFNKLWGVAKSAPFLQKKISRKLPDGSIKRTTRTNHLVNSHAFRILASGAALKAAAQLKTDSDRLRIPIGTKDNPGELRTAAWLPNIGKPTQHLFEQFLSAYTQECVLNALTIKESFFKVKKHQKITRKCMELAVAQSNTSIFGPTAFTAGFVQQAAPVAKKAAGDEKAEEAEAAEATAID